VAIEEPVPGRIVNAARQVHFALGPGFVESTYLHASGYRAGLILNFGRSEWQWERFLK